MEPSTVQVVGVIAVGIVAWSILAYMIIKSLLSRFVKQIDINLATVSENLNVADKDRQRLELQIVTLRGEFVSKRECSGCQSKLELKLDKIDEKFDKILLQQGGK